jgi:metal-sulfur cluster biosynthetic enzyme
MVPSYGGLFRLSDRDADAIGREIRTADSGAVVPEPPLTGEALEGKVWQTLKTCYDPEIPVNIVDLGLIYDMHIDQLTDGARVDVKMTLTAQGCGMGTSIAADARNKILDLPGVVEADVQVVWEPPWSPEKISPEGRALLGIH